MRDRECRCVREKEYIRERDSECAVCERGTDRPLGLVVLVALLARQVEGLWVRQPAWPCVFRLGGKRSGAGPRAEGQRALGPAARPPGPACLDLRVKCLVQV